MEHGEIMKPDKPRTLRWLKGKQPAWWFEQQHLNQNVHTLAGSIPCNCTSSSLTSFGMGIPLLRGWEKVRQWKEDEHCLCLHKKLAEISGFFTPQWLQGKRIPFPFSSLAGQVLLGVLAYNRNHCRNMCPLCLQLQACCSCWVLKVKLLRLERKEWFNPWEGRRWEAHTMLATTVIILC